MLGMASGANERALGQALFDYLRQINAAPADGSPEPANGFSDAPADEADGRPSEGLAPRGSARRRRSADEPTTVA